MGVGEDTQVHLTLQLTNLTHQYQLKTTSQKVQMRQKAICQKQRYLKVTGTSACREIWVLERAYRPDGLEQAYLALRISICGKKIARR